MARPTPPEPKVFCDAALTAKGSEWYHRTYFAHARDEPLLGDKSTSYLEDPRRPGARRGGAGRGDVVVLLRDPVRRAVSNWRFSTDNGLETRPLEEALRADLRDDQPWDPRPRRCRRSPTCGAAATPSTSTPWSADVPDDHARGLPRGAVGDPDALPALVGALGVDPARTPPPPDGGQRERGRRADAGSRREGDARGVLRGQRRPPGRPARETGAVVSRDEREVPRDGTAAGRRPDGRRAPGRTVQPRVGGGSRARLRAGGRPRAGTPPREGLRAPGRGDPGRATRVPRRC